MTTTRMMLMACCAMGTMMTAAPRALAGPYPLEQLMVWLETAEQKLAVVELRIEELKRQIGHAKTELAAAEKAVARERTPSRAMITRVNEAKKRLGNLESELAEAQAHRDDVLDYINWIRLQIAAWGEINPKGGAK